MPQPGKTALICLIMAATASMSVAAGFSDSDGFTAAFGGEYQFISQQYYNAVLDTSTLDPFEIWQLDQDEINDYIFNTNLKYSLLEPNHSLDLLADLELSGDRLLGRSEGTFRLGDYDNHLQLFSRLEAKSPSGDNEDRIEEYNYYQAYLSGRRRLGRMVGLDFKAGYEIVDFAEELVHFPDSLIISQNFFNYDYRLISARLGGDFRLSEFTSELSCRAGFDHRIVPDSAEAEYDQYRFDLEYVYFSLAGNLSLQCEVEFRDYAQPSGRDDFTALGFMGRFGRSLSNRLEAGLVLWADIYRYGNPDIVNRNHAHIRGELEGIVRVNGFGWGPLVKMEIRDEKAVDDYVFDNFNESFRQWEVGIRAEYLTRRELYFDGEATYGRRDYTGGSSILSSYNLWSISFIAGYSILKNISLNLMFDGSLERHKLTQENTDLYLFSAGVTARI